MIININYMNQIFHQYLDLFIIKTFILVNGFKLIIIKLMKNLMFYVNIIIKFNIVI